MQRDRKVARTMCLAFFLAAGCSFDAGAALETGGTGGIENGGASGGTGGTGGTGATGGIGGTGGADVDAAPPDAAPDAPPPPDAAIDAPPPVCSFNLQRVCIDGTTTGHCMFTLSGLVAVVDRHCPPSSSCVGAGLCQPPPGATTCNSPVCPNSTDVCDLYVRIQQLVGFCTPAIASASGGLMSACSADSSCATGLCATETGSTTPLHECLYPCTRDTDCPGGHCRGISAPSLI